MSPLWLYGTTRLKATKMGRVEVRRSPTIGDGGVRKQVCKYVRFTYKWESNLGRAGRRYVQGASREVGNVQSLRYSY